MIGFLKHWREARAQAAAKRAELESRFNAFLRETQPLVPRGSKHPTAALYRHAWKRASVLGFLYQQRLDERLTAQFKELEKLAGERYFEVAPVTLYGKAPLMLAGKSSDRLLEFETQRLFPTEGKQQRIRPLACIYIGRCKQGRVYVGQTVGPPEGRWLQHRVGRTGPYKKEDKYVKWEVIEEAVDPAKLNERESYHIGFYNADKEGYNDTRGNHLGAYERGRAERLRKS